MKDMLGKQIKDTVTGMTGTAVSMIKYMNGCVQYSIQPRELKDGLPIEAKWFDIEQIEIVKDERVVKAKKKPVGGPSPANTPTFGR